jgi:serralysin
MDGDDHLSGDGDDDELHGGDGADIIVAGAGRDTLIGGDGADTFVFAHADYGIVSDFESGIDTLQIAFFQGGYSGLTMYDDAFGNAVIEYTNDFGEHITIELTGASVSTLSPSDFLI